MDRSGTGRKAGMERSDVAMCVMVRSGIASTGEEWRGHSSKDLRLPLRFAEAASTSFW